MIYILLNKPYILICELDTRLVCNFINKTKLIVKKYITVVLSFKLTKHFIMSNGY